jgi:hypothetical protein
MWRARLIAVEEGGGAVATMAGDWFLAVNAMSYLTSHHGEAEATDRDDGNGQGSRVVVARHLGSQSSDTPLWFLTPPSCAIPVLAGGRAHRLLSSRLLSCITRRSGRACHDTSVSTQARLEPM